MKSYQEYATTARSGRPFSNGTEWDLFQFNVCMGQGNPDRRCVHDDSIDDDGGCPLIMVSLQDKWPREWVGARFGPTRCTEKFTAAEQRRADRLDRESADAARLQAEHYPMFPEASG